MRTYAEVVRSRAQDEHEGLRFEGRSWSWAEVINEASTRAAVLGTIGPGDGRSQVHVGILLQNTPDYIFWLLAAALSGDVVVGINPTRRGAELTHDMMHADCDLLVSEPLYLAADDRPDLPVPADRIFDVESRAYAELLASHAGAALPADIPDPSAIYLLLFSSGSTGAPKAVICTQGRLGTVTPSLTDRISLHRGSVSYLHLPLFHGHGIMMNLATAAEAGATVVMVRKFSASRFSRDIRENKVTFVNYVGRVLSYILAQPEDPADAENCLEAVFGSEASPAEAEAFRTRFGCEVREGFGSSEGIIRIVPVPGTPAGALGLPAAGMTVEIRSADGAECPGRSSTAPAACSTSRKPPVRLWWLEPVRALRVTTRTRKQWPTGCGSAATTSGPGIWDTAMRKATSTSAGGHRTGSGWTVRTLAPPPLSASSPGTRHSPVYMPMRYPIPERVISLCAPWYSTPAPNSIPLTWQTSSTPSRTWARSGAHFHPCCR